MGESRKRVGKRPDPRLYPARLAELSQAELDQLALRRFDKVLHWPRRLHRPDRLPRALRDGDLLVTVGKSLCGRQQQQVTLDSKQVTCGKCWRAKKGKKLVPVTRSELPPDLLEQIAALRAAGRDLSQIAQTLSVPVTVVHQALRSEQAEPWPLKALMLQGVRKLKAMDLPFGPAEAQAAALHLAASAGEEAVVRAFIAAAKEKGGVAWTYPNWWRERAKRLSQQR